MPMFYKLGETSEEIHIDTLEQNKDIALCLAQQARHSIDIFTQDMDTGIYSNQAFEKSVFELAKRHPQTKIRILTQDSSQAVRSGHRLIKLAQTITSSVFIHKPSFQYENEKCGFIVADKLGFLYRTNANSRNYKASVNFMSPKRAKRLTDFFTEIWEQSSPDIQTRRLYV